MLFLSLWFVYSFCPWLFSWPWDFSPSIVSEKEPRLPATLNPKAASLSPHAVAIIPDLVLSELPVQRTQPRQSPTAAQPGTSCTHVSRLMTQEPSFSVVPWALTESWKQRAPLNSAYCHQALCWGLDTYWIFLISLWDSYYNYPTFTNEEIKIHRGYVTCPRPHSKFMEETFQRLVLKRLQVPAPCLKGDCWGLDERRSCVGSLGWAP